MSTIKKPVSDRKTPTTSKPKSSRTGSLSPGAEVSDSDPTGTMPDNVMKKKELIDKAVARSGIKKKDAKLVVEALLAEVGEALAAGRDLNLPPLGRVRINRQKELANGRVIIVKVRQNTPKSVKVTVPSHAAE